MNQKSENIAGIFSSIKWRWNILILIKVLFISLAATFLFYQATQSFGMNLWYSLSFLVLLIALLGYFFNLGRISNQSVAQLLDRQIADLEDSSQLLLQDEGLTLIARIQRDLINNRLNRKLPTLVYPVSFKGPIIVSFLLLVMAGVIVLLNKQTVRTVNLVSTSQGTISGVPDERLPIRISNSRMEVLPPAYTGLSRQQPGDFHLEIASGSRVIWELEFNQQISGASLIWGIDNDFPMKHQDGMYRIESQIASSGFYSFLILSDRDTLRTEFYRVDVIPDLPPKISNVNTEPYLRLMFRENLEIPVSADLSDDYALSEAYIVATVSKGAGEGVSFREERVSFDAKVKGKKRVNLNASLLGEELQLEPGSELYYYIEAWDNKYPKPNRSRTETFFVVVEDTAVVDYGDFGGLAVDIMPDFFRSQRQIIIETEKLIQDKPKLSVKDFKFKSNELGFDQKVLRLKYSQFLGEEFESGIELEDSETPSGDEALEILEETHAHDEELDPNEEEDPLEAVSHVHDTEEETSYFSISVEAKLRAALVEMWDAELHLRLYDPKTSLPYQYRALELIKEIKNHARIYVKRVGFEPPPLTEEKRLSGKQNEINPKSMSSYFDDAFQFTNLKLAATILDNVILAERQITDNERAILKACGNEIAYIIDTNPLEYLDILQELKRISESKATELSDFNSLRSHLYNILNDGSRDPGVSPITNDPLKENYFKRSIN